MPTILIVDDEPRIVELARDYLEHAGFEVVTAGDGTAGLATARDLRPDLVVLDLGLPGMDGLDVTRELRRESAIPIVMLTARDDELDRVLGLELGADDYITSRSVLVNWWPESRRCSAGRTDRPSQAAIWSSRARCGCRWSGCVWQSQEPMSN